MIAVFPPPYGDEMLYSVCARYSRLTGYGNLETNLRDLFGRATVTAVVDLPLHLDALAKRLALVGGPSADEMLDQHTLLPYYAAFHAAERRAEARTAMRGEKHPYMLLGLLASRVPNMTTLRYCPSCAAEDRVRYGQTYWHRLHQLPGVLVCTQHTAWLECSTATVPASTNRHAFADAETMVSRDCLARYPVDGYEKALMVDLAYRARGVLLDPALAIQSSAWRQRYLEALDERGLLSSGGLMRLEGLRKLFREFYPDQYLHRLGIDPNDEDWWLRILRKPVSQKPAAHTLQHLLLQAMLQLDPHDSTAPTTVVSQPFGAGPWPCLNHASGHYGELRIDTVTIHRGDSRNRRSGTFACSCGFAYSRGGPDRAPEDAFRRAQVVAYGPVWTRALRSGWSDPELSLNKLAQRLGVTIRTVKARARALRLPQQRPANAKTLTAGPEASLPTFSQRREVYRDDWLKLRCDHPEASFTMLRKRAGKSYHWLSRNDDEWLQSHRPAPRNPWRSGQKANWEDRDAALSLQLRHVAHELYRQESPVWVTRHRLGQEAGHWRQLKSNLSKLPRCAQVLAELTETHEASVVRRIRWISARLQKSGERLPRWRFVAMIVSRPALLERYPEAMQVFEQEWRKITERLEGTEI